MSPLIPNIYSFLTESNDESSLLKLYHYDKLDNLSVLDPEKTNPNLYSRDEYKAWDRKRIFFYTDPSQIKSDKPLLGTKHLYLAEVDRSKIYDISIDDKGYYSKANKITMDIEDKLLNRNEKTFTDDIYSIHINNGDNIDDIIKSLLKLKVYSDTKLIKPNTLDKKNNRIYQFLLSPNLSESDINKAFNKFIKKYPESDINFSLDIKGDRRYGISNKYEELYNIIKPLGYIGIMYEHIPGEYSNKTVVIWEPVQVVKLH